ncbi:MAG: hypothetical protein LBE76_00645 [Nitrososphaerota archaeon]|jgi:hypothetical protein|nr:hypothetical protein [Nitrososphaerota archaeon]
MVDFRVEAEIGHYEEIPDHPTLPVYFVSDASSGWSNVQTFTMPGGFSTSQPSQTTNQPTTSDNNQPHQSEQNQLSDLVFDPLFMFGVGALLGGVVVAVVLGFAKRQHSTQTLTNQISNTTK